MFYSSQQASTGHPRPRSSKNQIKFVVLRCPRPRPIPCPGLSRPGLSSRTAGTRMVPSYGALVPSIYQSLSTVNEKKMVAIHHNSFETNGW